MSTYVKRWRMSVSRALPRSLFGADNGLTGPNCQSDCRQPMCRSELSQAVQSNPEVFTIDGHHCGICVYVRLSESLNRVEAQQRRLIADVFSRPMWVRSLLWMSPYIIYIRRRVYGDAPSSFQPPCLYLYLSQTTRCRNLHSGSTM